MSDAGLFEAHTDDTRANAMSFTNLTVDPTNAATDLTEVRGALRTALKNAKDEPNEAFVLLPLADIAPDKVDPRSAMTLQALWEAHPDRMSPPEPVMIDAA